MHQMSDDEAGIPSAKAEGNFNYFVDEHGLLGNANAHYVSMGVRPACVISDYAPIKKKKNGDYKFDWLSLLKFD